MNPNRLGIVQFGLISKAKPHTPYTSSLGGSHSSVLSVVSSPSQSQQDHEFIVSDMDESVGCADEDEVDVDSANSVAGESSAGGLQEVGESVWY